MMGSSFLQAFVFFSVTLVFFSTINGIHSTSDEGESWRASAIASIEANRKSNLTVLVRALNGQVIPDAQVTIQMQRHAFHFGTCVRAKALLINETTNDRFQRIIRENFNSIVFENELKWPQWEESQSNTHPEYRLEWTEAAIEWARSNGIEIRGHAMIWGSWRFAPGSVPRDEPGLRAATAAHIQDIGSRTRGRMLHWDVVNEPWSEHDFTDILGLNATTDWFKLAAAVDPAAYLYLNDYPWPENTEMIDYDNMVISSLKRNGATIHGMGIQAHIDVQPWDIPRYLAMVDRFAANGIRTAITEYDTLISDENLDARFLGDFLTATFAHPAMNSFLLWGFWDPVNWRGQAPFYRADWSEKPALAVYRNLVFREWWSNVEGVSNGAGSLTSRVFHGTYDVRVSKGDVSQTRRLYLGDEDQTITITL